MVGFYFIFSNAGFVLKHLLQIIALISTSLTFVECCSSLTQHSYWWDVADIETQQERKESCWHQTLMGVAE